LLTIVQGWGVKSELLESVGTVVAYQAKQMQNRVAKMAEDASRASTPGNGAQPTEQWYYYYYAEGKERKGPFSPQQLKQLATSGGITPSTMVWKKGMASWTSASQIKGLLPPTEESPPPVPEEAEEPPPVVT
jgi:hypothetical protein